MFLKKITIGLMSALSIGIAQAETVHNQNLGLRISNHQAKINYDFRIPNQKVFSMNEVIYSNQTEQEFVKLSTGVYIKEKTSFSGLFSLGGVIHYFHDIESEKNIGGINVYMGLSDQSKTANSLYYNLEASFSPNILTLGGKNMGNLSGELGLHLTPSSNFFLGYDVNYNLNFDNEQLIHYPYIGFAIDF